MPSHSLASFSAIFPVCPGRTVLRHPIEAFDSEPSRFGLSDSESSRRGNHAGGRMPVVESAAPRIKVSCRVDGQRGSKRRRPLLDCATARFEDAVPVRPFPWSRGGRHFPGWYWAATTGSTSAVNRGWTGTGWFSWTSILRPAALLASAQDELHTYLDASRAIRTAPTNDGSPTPAAPLLPGS